MSASSFFVAAFPCAPRIILYNLFIEYPSVFKIYLNYGAILEAPERKNASGQGGETHEKAPNPAKSVD